MKPHTKEWLIVFFVHEIAMYRPIIDDIIQDIERKGCGPDTAFYLLRDSVDEQNGTLFFMLSLFELKKINAGFEFVKVPVDFNNEDRYCWETGLRYIFAKESANRNMIITLSHGAAFGINRDFGPVIRSHDKNGEEMQSSGPDKEFFILSNFQYYIDQKERTEIEAFMFLPKVDIRSEIKKGKINKYAGRKNRACRSLEILWTADLAKALDRLPGKPVIDIMLMGNCFMQSFDTGYILKEKVNYLIAPQTGLPVNGYDLVKLMDHFNDPKLSTKDLSGRIISDYQVKNPPGAISSDFVALSANKLDVYEKLFRLFERLLALITKDIQSHAQELIAIRERQILYVSFSSNICNSNELMMIDMYLWIQLVLQACPNLPGSAGLADEFKKLLEELVVARHEGQFFVDHDAHPDLPKFGVQGLSVFYPKKSDLNQLEILPFCAYFDNKVPSPFKKDSSWDEFIKKYYRL